MTTITDKYPSRIAGVGQILQRQDPVLHGSEPRGAGPLTPSQLEAYGRDGFLFIDSFFDCKELDTLHTELNNLRTSERVRQSELAITEPMSGETRSVFAVHTVSELFAKLACDERLLGIVQHILDSDVYIHQSRLNFKPGFRGKEFYWHSDFETWHVEDGMPNMRAVSCSILLTPNNDQNGPLMIMPGSHQYFISCIGETPDNNYKESLRKQEYGVPDPDSLRFLADQNGIRSMTAPAGSIVFFDCNAMHGSNSNISPYPRSNVFFVYNSTENALGSPKYGLKPRPEHVATREDFSPTKPVEPDYLRDVSKHASP